MIKGLSITPPVLGRISIGRVVERNGKRLPEKDDQFTITSQVQTKDGWVLHPFDETLRKNSPNGKLRSIPVTLLFNDPDLNLRAEYSLFDRNNGRPMCVGNGETCRRVTTTGIHTLPCPGTDGCEMAKGGACKPYGRLNVKLGDDDELGTFIFRTTGYNSIRTLAARLHYFKAISGDLLACMPLELRLRGKSTAQSRGTPIYYVDLTVREGMTLDEALTHAQQTYAQRQALAYDQKALDAVARAGFGNGAFEDDPDEALDVMEEFYSGRPVEDSKPIQKPSLNAKLERIAAEAEVASA
ncbi:hydrolase or metal-binding protein [Alcaligenes sp. HNGD-HTN06]|uniref:recombination directionality factor n=1 Tax=Alcaligenes sp. HNGD-HTN06 TaxID=3416924 RepID=UPI003CE968AF